MEATIKLTVNGQERSVNSEPQRPLLDVLREDLELTGTKYGCGEARCGACTVLVDGKRVYSCRTAVEDVAGKKILTIEGVSKGGALNPVQEAFLAEDAFQCGYCASGMIMSAVALVAEKPDATEAEAQAWMNRHICRCCSYASISKALHRCLEGGKGGQP